ISYPSARRRVRMCSEATVAVGQPTDTKPTRGRPGALKVVMRGKPVGSVRACAERSALTRSLRAFVLESGRKRIAVFGFGVVGELEAGEHVARLALELTLHLLEHRLGLVDVGAHHALQRRPLEVQELGPEILSDRTVLAVDGTRLILQLGLHLGEGLDVALEVLAHHALHRVAVETD